MPRTSCFLLQFIAYCVLNGVAFAIIGRNVRNAAPHEFHYVVSLSTRPPRDHLVFGYFVNRHFCTGTLITRKSVITAAHCLLGRQPSEVVIIAGSTNLRNGKKYCPVSWVTYDEWKYGWINENTPHDVGIVKLIGQGVNNATITPTSISFGATLSLYNTKIRLAGWGVTASGNKPKVLRSAALVAISREECIEQASNLSSSMNRTLRLPADHFCSLAKPWVLSTSGDGGGPLLDRHRDLVAINIGVIANLEGSSYTEEFINENQLNVHLSLTHYRDFITQVSSQSN